MATAQDVIDRAEQILHDVENVRWTTDEMLLWITDAQREAVTIKPNLFTKTVVRTLAAGATQSLVDLTDLAMLISVNRNMNADGVNPGRMIVVIDPALMDAIDPDWQVATQESPVVHYMYALDRRYEYRVQPPAVNGSKVEVTYAAIPPVVTAVGDVLSLRDHCVPAVVDYVCYRAVAKDTDAAAMAEKSLLFLKAFTEAVPRL